ncbi:MAG: toll/interleukin-1 receptor domain-containing protein [Verrucomicrobiales bacterium]|nr:toll/interleukin-1 receptor domain-containing protein [Verrucomicrobiales bacterium]
MKPSSGRRIFISYSHRGKGPEWKAALLRALQVFEQQHLLDVWEDGKIRVSSYWEDDIERAMDEAALAVVLLTPEALQSEFILAKELPRLRDRQRDEHLPVFPVICEDCDWRLHDWLQATQAPNGSNPLSVLQSEAQERVFRQLATAIAEELSRIALGELPADAPPPSDDRIYLDQFPLTRGPSLREEKLIGREQELALLDLAFAQPHTAIVSLVAWGGVGKTMLVQHWLRRLMHPGSACIPAGSLWLGTRRVYAWSFYSQGTQEDRQASEDLFLAHALAWFGVQCEPTLSPWDKGRLLAEAVVRERTLLILDGIEPLQYPPGPMGGQLRAPGVQRLLKQLARKASSGNRSQESGSSNCLCLVTTREPLTDLADFQRREGSPWGSVIRVDLGNLTDEAGAALLHHAGANRAGVAEIKADDKELLAASREVDGHALTLNLLGRFLARAHGGDILRRDLVKFEDADRQLMGGSTFKMLAAFEKWFDKSGSVYRQSLAILRMLGLFDRPADEYSLGALRRAPAISGLTTTLFTTDVDAGSGKNASRPLSDEEWCTAISFLTDFGLLYVRSIADKGERLLDCHPLIREHFKNQLRIHRARSWRVSHRRLFTALSRMSTPPENPTIADLQPRYHAVAHGCYAGIYGKALKLYLKCIAGAGGVRSKSLSAHYSLQCLGSFSQELAAISSFFDHCWNVPSPRLRHYDQSWLVLFAGFVLRGLGRYDEAVGGRSTHGKEDCSFSSKIGMGLRWGVEI